MSEARKALPGAILHVVMGTQGSYSDHSLWAVAAYLDKAKAEAHAEKLNAWVQAYRTAARQDGLYSLPANHPLRVSPDPNDRWMTMTYVKGKPCYVPAEPPSYHTPYLDREYSVDVLFLHDDPENFASEHAVLLDFAREKGLLP